MAKRTDQQRNDDKASATAILAKVRADIAEAKATVVALPARATRNNADKKTAREENRYLRLARLVTLMADPTGTTDRDLAE